MVEDEKNRLIGRGATDDKGPVLGWINVVEAHKALGLELPVNIKFCLEGMEESGSEGLDKLIFDEADKYFKDVDAVCISDNYWLGTTKPCLTYGLRGVSYFHLKIKGPVSEKENRGRIVLTVFLGCWSPFRCFRWYCPWTHDGSLCDHEQVGGCEG